jgi:hypothetical protein
MAKYRNEWKYVCSAQELILLEQRLSQIAKLDTHAGPSGIYSVRSLYFDDYVDSSAYQNAAGLPDRAKWRIRYYGGGTSRHMHLEYKKKSNGVGKKLSCKVSPTECNKIIRGEHLDVLWGTDKDLLKRFCGEISTKVYKPKVIVDYDRKAYVEPIANIRITFDMNISVSYEFDKFTTGKYLKIPLQQDNKHVLEVKFDDILPSYIRNIINSYGQQQGSFSKYYLGRKRLEEII